LKHVRKMKPKYREWCIQSIHSKRSRKCFSLHSELIQRVLQGDDAAYTLLVQEHQEAAFRLAYLILGDADDAQDVAQDAFIRAYRNLHRFDTQRPFRPWILQITANLARNRLRALGRYLQAAQRFLRLNISQEAPSNTENESIKSCESQDLWTAVQRLRSEAQDVIYLRFFLELSVAETAEILNIPEGTVKSRLNRALQQLRGVVLSDFPLLLEGRQL
jgi:RNA polymerase sigma-70 factor (ECF subfamily)